MKIAFYVNQFSIRGTEVAIYDYAFYNRKILGNESIIVAKKSHKLHRHFKTGLTHCEQVEKKFRDTFRVLLFEDVAELDKILIRETCNILHILKSGDNDNFISNSIPTAVHCVFTCDHKNEHGDVYVAISDCINTDVRSFNTVPHICNKLDNDNNKNLRLKLGIPNDANVFGRYGGVETFNLEFVHDTIKRVLESTDNVFFIFMNTEVFFTHPKIFYLEKDSDTLSKATFINTCDAMIHARDTGESFGISIAEFTTLGKPIITWKHDGPPNNHEDLNHIDVLGDTGIYYKDKESLYQILTNFIHKSPVNYNELYNPKIVMSLFKRYITDPIMNIKLKILCNWATSSEIHKSWSKMIGNNPFRLVDTNPDYYIIINKPPENVYFDPKKTIVMGMEPDTFISNRWTDWYNSKSDFLYFIDENYMNNFEWWVSLDASRDTLPINKTKGNIISSIVSSQYIYQGHKLRIDFIKRAEYTLNMEIYGWDNKFNFKSYIGSLYENKDDGLYPYKYTISAENTSRRNYCTEKLIDAILSETLCFYWGCPNLDEYIDPRCFIYIDLTNHEESINVIKDAIENNEWEKRIDCIRRMKHHIITKLSCFSRIHGIIKLHELDKRVINLDGSRKKMIQFNQNSSSSQVKNIIRYSAKQGENYTHLINDMFNLTANFVGPGKNTFAIIGCALSHFFLWEEIVDNGKPMMIMEDDVSFCDNFLDHISTIMLSIDETNDLIFFGYHNHEDNYNYHNIPISHFSDVFRPNHLIPFEYSMKYGTSSDSVGLIGGGTFGYILTPSGASKLINMVKQHKFYFPVDYQMLEGGKRNELNIYLTSRKLVTSPKFGFDTYESDIQRI